MGSIEIGSCEIERFEADKNERVMENELSLDALYSWMSLCSEGNACIYPSRIFSVAEHAPSGLQAIRFAILSSNLQQLCTSYSLFADGLYFSQRNGQPFNKHGLNGSTVTVEDGYFAGPISVDCAELGRGMHGHMPAAQAIPLAAAA